MTQADPSRASGLWRWGWAALALILIAAPICVRVGIDGRAQLREAEAAAEAGDLDAEIRHLGRAARFALPLATHDDDARGRLEALAESAQERGQSHDALVAWRELRRALLASRAIDVADPEQLRRANAAIVELMVVEARAAGEAIERERWAAELDEDTGSRARSLLAAACFVAWLIACVGFFALGLDAKGRLVPRPALRWGAAGLILLVAWIVLM